MKRNFALLACVGALALTACTSESKLPQPNGKGGVRAINAIPGSPFVEFRIEERSLAGLTYKASSTPALYDDFFYNFNFDIDDPDTDEQRRIATVTTQVEVNREHVFALTGSIDNPTVLTWTTDLRAWDGTETVFEARFAHLSVTLDDIDVFFQDPDDPITAGGHVARLSYGDIMDFADFAGDGTYKVTITAAGDVNMLHFESGPLTFIAQSSSTISLFDGNENDTSPYVLGSMSANGQSLRIPDPAYLPTVRFINAATNLQAVDVYRDELLTEVVTTNVVPVIPTVDVEVPVEDTTFYFTPTGSAATTLFSQAIGPPPSGVPTELFLIGESDTSWRGVNLAVDRSSSENIAKFSLFNASFNNQLFEVFIVARDEAIGESQLPAVPRVNYGLPSNTAVLDTGSYDIYVTSPGTRDAIGGPFQLDVVRGDVVLLVAIDDVDPTAVQIVDVSVPVP
jgi:hypothetical protein